MSPGRRPVGRRFGRRGAAGARADRGQATVELALVLPVLVLFLLALVQTALVARDAVLVQDAARAAVREASVGASSARVRARRRGARSGGVEVDVRRTGVSVRRSRCGCGTGTTPICPSSGRCSPTSRSGRAR